MDKKGIEKKYLMELIVFLAVTIVIIGATIIIWQKLQGPTKIEVLRNKVEIASITKDFTFGASVLPQDYFRCGTERVYLFEDSREELSNELLEKAYATWYGYGEGKIDFVSNWADSYFSLIENPACYICYITSNDKVFGPSDEWKQFLGKSKYSGFDGPIYIKDDKVSDDPTGLEIGPNKPLFIGYTIWKVPSIEKDDSFGEIAFKLSFYRTGYVAGAFVLSDQELNNFCKKEIFIDI